MAMTNVNIRMDENLKKEFETIIDEMGLNMTTALNVYVRAVVRERRIPFEVSVHSLSSHVPNAETIAAIQEIEDMKSGKIPTKLTTVEEFIEEMKE